MENPISVHMIDGFENLIHVILDSLLREVVSPTFDCLIHVHIHKLENKSQAASRLITKEKTGEINFLYPKKFLLTKALREV